MKYRTRLVAFVIALLAATILPAGAADHATNYFYATWARTDKAVADGMANRTWMWGPEPFSVSFLEYYEDAPQGFRLVQYYDKSRMEITNPADEYSEWYVTNGLLVVELISGRMQIGDDNFEFVGPASINVAGDPDDPDGPTYQSFASVLEATPGSANQTITRTIARDGETGNASELASFGAIDLTFEPETGHWVASPFWDFMTSSGLVFDYYFIYDFGEFSEDRLFENPYYATGFPITDAYWATVQVGGTSKEVLIQCFQRRCLTWTPDNPEGWKVEAGNVGLHYWSWRYGDLNPDIPTEDVEIVTVYPGSQDPSQPDEEYVVIRNNSERTVDIGDWVLWDRDDDLIFVFPEVDLVPGAEMTIHSCDGQDTQFDIYTGYCDSWWDFGDYAVLLDDSRIVVDYYWYSAQ